VQAARVPGDGILRVRRETSGRKGKTVTTISGASPAQAAELSRELKRLCGSGGSVVDGVIEIQGDHRAKVVAHLEAGGLQVKSAGG
jgi:translation initiation factor 1